MAFGLTTKLAARLLPWANRVMETRKPDFVIGDQARPYLLRWWIIPRNPIFNIYLHRILRSDDDVLHDHPWWNASLVLAGGYIEHTPGKGGWAQAWFKPPGTFKVRGGKSLHRLELRKSDPGAPDGDPSTSLFITGPKFRVWGFQCPKGWMPFHEFIKARDGGNSTGKGCGD